MSKDWQTLQRAVQAWVVEGSGLPGARVIWTDQKGIQPAKPYITLAWIGEAGVGSDEQITRNASSPQAGAEIENVVRGNRVETLSVQVYLTSGDAQGARAGIAILGDVRSQRFVEETAEALREAGVGVANMAGIRTVGITVDSVDIEPRAVMEVSCNIGSELVRTGTYIQTAEITNETTGEVFEAPERTPAVGAAAGSSTATGAGST